MQWKNGSFIGKNLYLSLSQKINGKKIEKIIVLVYYRNKENEKNNLYATQNNICFPYNIQKLFRAFSNLSR